MNMNPHEFWEMTYAEFLCKLAGYNHRQKREYNDRIVLARNIAYFSNWFQNPDNIGKVFPIENFLIGDDNKPKQSKPQTTDQMMAMAMLWNAALGGSVVEN